MKIIVYYVDFHWDNYQGGSGKSFEMRFVFDIPQETKACDVINQTLKALDEHVKKERPFQSTDKYSIQRMEII